MPARLAFVPYHFSISITGGFAFVFSCCILYDATLKELREGNRKRIRKSVNFPVELYQYFIFFSRLYTYNIFIYLLSSFFSARPMSRWFNLRWVLQGMETTRWMPNKTTGDENLL